jgi:Ca-activated chloride channel family protein
MHGELSNAEPPPHAVSVRISASWLMVVAGLVFAPACASAQERTACSDDAMLVFDASSSMAAADVDKAGLRRIDSVRTALARILPSVAPKRRLGLVTYGPGPRDACENVTLELRPQLDAAAKIQSVVNDLIPAGRTPLTRAVSMAASALDARNRPATIVLLTDGEETCRADPCALAKTLKSQAPGLVVHVVSYRIKDSLGSDQVFHARCLAEQTGGLSVQADTTSELVDALQKTLGCPLLSRSWQPESLPSSTRSVAPSTTRSVASVR